MPSSGSNPGTIRRCWWAIWPIHLTPTTTDRPPQHIDDDAATGTLDELRAEAAATGASLIGPLWPYPGVVDLTGSDPVPVPVLPT